MVAIVVTKSASMPSTCKGNYRRVAVVDVPYWLAWNENYQPRMISERDKEVYRIIIDLGAHNVGKTERCAFQKAIKRAEILAKEYNNARTIAEAEQIIGAGGSA